MVQRVSGVLREFRGFALRGNAVDLAVAVVLGAAFGATITSIVKNLLTPLIGAIFGTSDFSTLSFPVNPSVFRYGDVLNAVISFVLIAAAVFFVVVKPTSVLRHRLGWDPPEEPAKSPCPRCLTEIPVAATRCAACTTELTAPWAPVSAEA